MKSTRPDKRGHWPRGKRRSRISARQRNAFVKAVQAATARDDCSNSAVARLLEVSERTVRRWLKGEDWPDKAVLARSRRLPSG